MGLLNWFRKNLLIESKISLHIITMNRRDLLEKQLKECVGYFDVIRVCGGALEDGSREVCEKYNAEFYYRKWDDKYQEQDNVLLDRAKSGDWVMIMDDDEIPSIQLLSNLRTLTGYAEGRGYNMISLPCNLALNGELECPIPQFIDEVKIGERTPFRKYWLFRYDRSVRSYGTPHRLVESEYGWTVYNQPNPYIHYKTTKGFILNDCIHSFINQQDQGYSVKEACELLEAFSYTGWEYSVDVIPGVKSGDVPKQLLAFAWKYKDQVNRSISRWFWVYYFIFHKEELPADFDFENDPSYKEFQKFCSER